MRESLFVIHDMNRCTLLGRTYSFIQHFALWPIKGIPTDGI